MATDEEIIQRILGAARDSGSAAGDDHDAADYDWTVPHRLSGAQLEKLSSLASAAAGNLSVTLAGVTRTELSVEAAEPSQQYGKSLKPLDEEQHDDYYFGLSQEGGQRCGFVTVSAREAAGWVASLLGGTPGEQDRQMSALEVSLLNDVVASLAGGFSQACQTAGPRTSLAVEESICSEADELVPDETEEYCRIAFKEAESEGDALLAFVLRSDVLETILDPEIVQNQRSPQERSNDLLSHVQGAGLLLTVNVGASAARVRDIAAMESGDVLILQTRLDEPVELLARDKAVSAGFLQTCEGHYAVRISQPLAAYAQP